MDRAESDQDEWIDAAQRGSRDAFDALVELHGRSVLRCVEGFVGARSEAEDLAQDALLQAYRRLETFKKGTNFRAWLLKIAFRTCLHARRKKSRVHATEQEQLAQVAARPDVRNDDELDEAVRQTIAELPEDQRTVVLLRFVEELSHAEIAQITDAEISTVRWRLFQARQTLQKRLKSWAPCEENKTPS